MTRLLSPAADVFDPDVRARRRSCKKQRKQARDADVSADEAVLAETGIRVLREKPVFTTPNVFPPDGLRAGRGRRRADFRETIEPQHCYVCKQPLLESSTSSTTSSARPAATSTTRSAPRPPT